MAARHLLWGVGSRQLAELFLGEASVGFGLACNGNGGTVKCGSRLEIGPQKQHSLKR